MEIKEASFLAGTCRRQTIKKNHMALQKRGGPNNFAKRRTGRRSKQSVSQRGGECFPRSAGDQNGSFGEISAT